MCGIVGYVGEQSAVEVLLGGLKRLEYRGYDSAGVAVLGPDGLLQVERKAGKLGNLEKEVDAAPPVGTLGIGHTRWATHGRPTDGNAHPHRDCSGKVAVVHNGTIDNFSGWVAGLEQRGHEMQSATDTEAFAHLVEERYTGDLTEAVRSVAREMDGFNSLLVVHTDHPDLVVAVRRGTRLVIGFGEGETFLGSDLAAFIAHTRRAQELEVDQVAEISRSGARVTDLDGTPVEIAPFDVTWDLEAVERDGYEFFMLKEIDEQPGAVRETLGGRMQEDGLLHLDELSMSDEDIRDIEQVIIIACGSAYYSGMVGKYAIERWCRIPVHVEIASEFRYRDPVLNRRTLVIAVSQSGETADTIEAVRHARSQRAKVLAVTNTIGSTVSRECDAALYTRGGPEIAVASTKAVMTQITSMYLVGLYLAQVRGTRDEDEVRAHLADLRAIPDLVQEVIDRMGPVRDLARSLAGEERVLFLGRHVGYPVALEGALNLKELA